MDTKKTNITSGSLAGNTWRSYNTIEGRIRKCGKELGRSISFPFSRKDVLNLVGYFLQKGLKVETISNYLASVRAAHIYRGVEYPDIREEMVEAVLSGARNRDLGESKYPADIFCGI